VAANSDRISKDSPVNFKRHCRSFLHKLKVDIGLGCRRDKGTRNSIGRRWDGNLEQHPSGATETMTTSKNCEKGDVVV
jgi:hypothetical protein